MKPTLQFGSTGSEVSKLQTCLRDQHKFSLVVDGVFGTNTETAVKQFQSTKNLKVDGIVGPLTWDALCGVGTANNTTFENAIANFPKDYDGTSSFCPCNGLYDGLQCAHLVSKALADSGFSIKNRHTTIKARCPNKLPIRAKEVRDWVVAKTAATASSSFPPKGKYAFFFSAKGDTEDSQHCGFCFLDGDGKEVSRDSFWARDQCTGPEHGHKLGQDWKTTYYYKRASAGEPQAACPSGAKPPAVTPGAPAGARQARRA